MPRSVPQQHALAQDFQSREFSLIKICATMEKSSGAFQCRNLRVKVASDAFCEINEKNEKCRIVKEKRESMMRNAEIFPQKTRLKRVQEYRNDRG